MTWNYSWHSLLSSNIPHYFGILVPTKHFIIISFFLSDVTYISFYRIWAPALKVVVKLWQTSKQVIYSDLKTESRGLIHCSCLHPRPGSSLWSLPLGFFPTWYCWKIGRAVLTPVGAHLLPQGGYLCLLGCWSSGGAGRMERRSQGTCVLWGNLGEGAPNPAVSGPWGVARTVFTSRAVLPDVVATGHISIQMN